MENLKFCLPKNSFFGVISVRTYGVILLCDYCNVISVRIW
jgi:hypothetical protein